MVDSITVEIQGIKTYPCLCHPWLCGVIVFPPHQAAGKSHSPLPMMIFQPGLAGDSRQINETLIRLDAASFSPIPIFVSIAFYFQSDVV